MSNSSLGLVGCDVFTDLEMFTSFSHNHTETIMHIFEQHTCNVGCVEFIADKLRKPIYKISDLERRQFAFREMLHIYNQNTDLVKSILTNIKAYERDVDWLFSSREDQTMSEERELVDVLEMVYFKLRFFHSCNKNGSLLFMKNTYTIIGAPVVGLLSPILYFVIPYLVIVYKLKFRVPITTFIKVIARAMFQNHNLRKLLAAQLVTYGVSLFFYFQNLFNTFELAKNTFKVCAHVVSKVKNVLAYLSECEKLKLLFNLHIKTTLPNYHVINNNTSSSLISSVSNFGSYLAVYKQFDMKALRLYLDEMNAFFANLSFVKIFNEYDMCFATYNNTSNPSSTYVDAENMYHIAIKKCTPNSILLNSSNCVITGPNAAGKSTFIKGLLLNVILSQTYGIANASRFQITPFYYINSQINIPDVKGKESLFEAEMFRCKRNIDIIKHLPPHLKGFVVMDEVFSSTNVVEGVAGAYGILEKMSSYSNICTVVTTHFLYLTRLPSFKKYKMNVVVSEDGERIAFPYRLTHGCSKQLIALELIKDNFDDDVIESALSIKNKLLV